MPDLSALLNACPFEGLAIDKTPHGYTASILTAAGWSQYFDAPSAAEAIAAALNNTRVIIPPCPVSLPPCPVP